MFTVPTFGTLPNPFGSEEENGIVKPHPLGGGHQQQRTVNGPSGATPQQHQQWTSSNGLPPSGQPRRVVASVVPQQQQQQYALNPDGTPVKPPSSAYCGGTLAMHSVMPTGASPGGSARTNSGPPSRMPPSSPSARAGSGPPASPSRAPPGRPPPASPGLNGTFSSTPTQSAFSAFQFPTTASNSSNPSSIAGSSSASSAGSSSRSFSSGGSSGTGQQFDEFDDDPAYVPPASGQAAQAPITVAQRQFFQNQVAAANSLTSPPGRKVLRERGGVKLAQPASPQHAGGHNAEVSLEQLAAFLHSQGPASQQSGPRRDEQKYTPSSSYAEALREAGPQQNPSNAPDDSQQSRQAEQAAKLQVEQQRLEETARLAGIPNPTEYAARIMAQRAAEQARAEDELRMRHRAEAEHVAEHLSDFERKMVQAVEKKKQAAAIVQAAAEARAAQRAEASAARKRRLAGEKDEVPPKSTTSTHEDDEIARALELRKEAPVVHPFTLPKPIPTVSVVDELAKTLELNYIDEPEPVSSLQIQTEFEEDVVLSAAQYAELTPRKEPQVVIKEVSAGGSSREPTLNFHSQVLAPGPSALLRDGRSAMREWNGCSCGCGVAQLSCNMLNQQAQLITNLKHQYEVLQQYVSHLHSGLLTHNIPIASILPASPDVTRAVVVGSLLTLEASNRNTVRDVMDGVRQAVPNDEQQAWLQTARHPSSLVANQPLQASPEHTTYARFMRKQFITTSDRNVFTTAKSAAASSSSQVGSRGDDDAPDTGLPAVMLSALPMSYDNQSITKTLFDVDIGRMRMDVPEVIVCDIGEVVTRPRANAIAYMHRSEVPGLMSAPPPVITEAAQVDGSYHLTLLVPGVSTEAAVPSPLVPSFNFAPAARGASVARGGRDHRISLSMGALAAGLQRDPSGSTSGERDPADALSRMLHTEFGLALMTQQCAEEHSGENIALWAAVEAYHADPDWVGRIDHARMIIRQHIARDAPEQINLPSQITDELLHMINTVEDDAELLTDGLTTAQSIALKLLNQDSYQRFLRGRHGETWRQYVAEHPELQQAGVPHPRLSSNAARETSPSYRGASGPELSVGSGSRASSPGRPFSLSPTNSPPISPLNNPRGGFMIPPSGPRLSMSPGPQGNGLMIPLPGLAHSSSPPAHGGFSIPPPSGPSRAASPPRGYNGPPLPIDDSVHSFTLWRLQGWTKHERALKFDPQARTLAMRSPAGVVELMFGLAMPGAGDTLISIKLSRNDPAKFTLSFHDKSVVTPDQRAHKTPQQVKLYLKVRGPSSAVMDERERMYQLMRTYGLLP